MEIASRALYWVFDKETGDLFIGAKKGHIYVPYIGNFHAPFAQVGPKLYADRHGFIHQGDSNRNLLVKSEKEFRIFILGGSTVEGTYRVSKNTTLAAILEEKLKNEFEDQKINLIPKVINAGMSSFFSSQEFALLKWYILPLNPDYVIFFDGTNDAINHNVVEGGLSEILKHDASIYHLSIFQNHKRMLSLSGLLGQFVHLAGEYSSFMSLVYKATTKFDRLLATLGINDKASQDEIDSTIQILSRQYQRNILASIGICRQFKIGIAYFLQPTLFNDTPNLTDKELKILESTPLMWHDINYFKYKRKFYDAASLMFDKLKLTNASDKVIIEDFSKIFTQETKKIGATFYGDTVHYTDAGRMAIVSEMIKRIRGDVFKKAREVEISASESADPTPS